MTTPEPHRPAQATPTGLFNTIYDWLGKSAPWSTAVSAGIASAVAVLILCHQLGPRSGTILTIVSVSLAYGMGLTLIHTHLHDENHRLPLTALGFIAITVLLTLFLCVPVLCYNFLADPGISRSKEYTYVCAFCFTVGELTTAGYRTQVRGSFAELYAAFIQLLGVTNAICFVAIVLRTFDNRPPQTPERENPPVTRVPRLRNFRPPPRRKPG